MPATTLSPHALFHRAGRGTAAYGGSRRWRSRERASPTQRAADESRSGRCDDVERHGRLVSDLTVGVDEREDDLPRPEELQVAAQDPDAAPIHVARVDRRVVEHVV